MPVTRVLFLAPSGAAEAGAVAPLIAAGGVVCSDVPEGALVLADPARIIWVNAEGETPSVEAS